MTTLQELFAKNGRIRNIIFIVAFSLMVLLVSTYLLMGHKFLYTAPLLLAIMLSGLALNPPKYYFSFCIGTLLSFGLFQATMGFLIVGAISPVFLYLFIGLIGFTLIITSVWQAIMGPWILPRFAQTTLNIVLGIGLLLIIFAIVKIEIHGIKVEETPRHETY